jgi:phosphohistidine phosphatase
MRIYLVQHGLALDESQDPKRPLSGQGLEDITRAAGFLSLFEKPCPAHVFHSSKLRAKQTATMIAEAWQVPDVVEEGNDLSPNANPEVWAAKLNAMHEDVLLVGHLPHLPKLASLLLCGEMDSQPIRFQNAGVLCLEKENGRYHVLWHINPTMFYETDD